MNQNKEKLKTQQKKKQDISDSNTIKKNLKGNSYDDLSKSQLVKHIRNKDREINQLQDKLDLKGKSQSEKANMYRLKLQDEIAQNEKAVKAFGSITQGIILIITKFKGLDHINKQELANAINLIQCQKDSGKKSIDFQQQQEQSQFSCFEQIVDETIKMLEHLGKLTDLSISATARIKLQLLKLETEFKKKQEVIIAPPNPVKLQAEQQIKLLKEEVNQLVLENKNLNKVLFQNQKEKNKLLMSILQSLTEQEINLLNRQTKEQLIQRIRRMTYRVIQLQKDKKEIFFKAKTQKQFDQKKFQILLKQVKQIRVNKKLSLSGI